MPLFDSRGWYTKAVNYASGRWRSPNFWIGNKGRRAVVLHVTDGTDSRATLTDPQNPAGAVSAHFLIRDDGIYQLVSVTDSSWANGIWEAGHAWRGVPESENPNRYTISIEREGRPFVPVSQRINDYTVQVLRDLAEPFPQFATYTPHVNLIGHYEISPAHRPNCPGPTVDFAALAALASQSAAPQPSAARDVPYIGVSQQPISQAVFTSVLKDHNSPMQDFEIAYVWQRLNQYNINAALFLAHWHAEDANWQLQSAGGKVLNPFNIKARADLPSANGWLDFTGGANGGGGLWLGLDFTILWLKWNYANYEQFTLRQVAPRWVGSAAGSPNAEQYIARILTTYDAIVQRQG